MTTETEALRKVEQAYLALLRMPHGEIRARLQPVLAQLLHCIAESAGREPEDVQDEYERRALSRPSPAGDDVENMAKAICLAQFGNADIHGDARCCQAGGADGCCIDDIMPIARAALAAAPGRVDWRPMDSAPRDGTRILLRFDPPFMDKTEVGVAVGCWTGNSEHWWLSCIWAASNAHREPVAWAPLPGSTAPPPPGKKP